MLLRKKMLLSVLSFVIIPFSFAGIIKGKVTDAKTGEPMVGATVKVEINKKEYTTLVNLDGTYIFKNLPAGTYELKVKFVGYKSGEEKNLVLKSADEIVVVNVELKDESKNLDEVTVSASSSKDSDKSARKLEKNSDNVQNILSAKTIRLLPDVTVANALQRMSGVTIERSSSGEGRYAIIRGMDQRYNSTLVNGIKIPSPDDKYRYVPMDIFPSDLLERLEVTKSLTPSMEADAIGGTMNLVMKNAPEKKLLMANVAGGYNTLFSDRPFSTFDHSVVNKKSPGELHGENYMVSPTEFSKANLDFKSKANPVNTTLGLTIGDRFLDKKLGIILSASYQDIYRGSNSDFFKPNEQPLPGNIPQFSDFLYREYSTRNQRVGITNKFDFLINKANRISLFNMYVHQNEFQSRYMVDSSAAANVGTFSTLNRSRWNIQSIYNSTLHGDHALNSKLKLDWSAVYSKAKNQLPDWAEYEITNSVTNAQNGSKGNLNSMSRRWMHNADRDLSGYLNLNYLANILKTDVEITVGGLQRNKERTNFLDEYGFKPVINNGQAQAYTNIYDAQWTFKGGDKVLPSFNNTANTYKITENISAGYAQAKFMLTKKLQVLGGMRIEYTEQKYNTQLPSSQDKKSGRIDYTDLLPSIHFKYAIDKKQNLRLSYYKALSRPGFGDLIPYNIAGEYYDEGGNPYVKHSRADNFDLRYEFFPGAADQFLLGAFYKRIQNPIEYGFATYGTTGKVVLQPQNFSDSTHNGNASNYGIEAVITKYIGMFGVSANYTFTKSEITTSKQYKSSIGGNTVTQTRPLQGQADHIGNISLLFKQPKWGLDMQLAFVYTGKRIAQVSLYKDLDYWQRPFTQLDFSLEQRITKQFSFYVKVNNISNSPRKIDLLQPLSSIAANNRPPDQENDDKILVQKDVYNLTFLGGFRFKL